MFSCWCWSCFRVGAGSESNIRVKKNYYYFNVDGVRVFVGG